MLGCISKEENEDSSVFGTREMASAALHPARRYRKTPQHQKDTEKLDLVQQRTVKEKRGYDVEKRQREASLFSLKDRGLRGCNRVFRSQIGG